MKLPEVTREKTFTLDIRRPRPERSEPVVAVRLHRRDLAPLVVELGDRALLVGRSDQADLRLHDKAVSRLHGLLRRSGEQWSYVEFGTGNGSFVEVDDQRIAIGAGNAVILAPDTPILLGNAFNRIEALTSLPPSEVNTGTRSVAGRALEARLASVATSKLSVLLHGPSGAGKTWAAQLLHERSGRRGNFVVINCARLPTDIAQLHSELLGHIRGAYTGAAGARVGSLFAAVDGTLFLDEIDSASEAAQGFFLDLLEGRNRLLPMGMEPQSKQAPQRPNVRFIAAAKTMHSKMRHDLHMRLMNGEVIAVPGLAERREDIPGFVEQLRLAADVDGTRPMFAPEAVVELQQAPWHGEMRALRAAVETLVDRAARGGIRVIDTTAVRTRLAEVAATRPPKNEFDDDDATGQFQRPQTLRDQPVVSAQKPAPRHFTRDDLLAALAQQGHNIDRTAAMLGWARNTLTKKMDEHGIPRPSRS